MKKFLVVATAATMLLAVAPAFATVSPPDWNISAPVSGMDYHIATQGTSVKVDMLGPIGDHTPFTVRIMRVGTKAPVFHQTSTYRSDLKRQAVGSGFVVSVGAYVWHVDQTWTHHSNVAAGAFVVTP